MFTSRSNYFGTQQTIKDAVREKRKSVVPTGRRLSAENILENRRKSIGMAPTVANMMERREINVCIYSNPCLS